MNLRLLLALSLFCVSLHARASSALPLRGVKVVFDQSHGQIFSPYNPAFEGYSSWTHQLVRWGAQVRLHSQPLSVSLKDKAAGTILVLGIGTTMKPYSPGTLRAILSFADRGGGVLVMAEHDDLFGVNTFQHRLTAPLGLRALPTGMFTSRKDTGNQVWIDAGLPSWGLASVRMYYVSPLVVSAPACPLLLGRKITFAKHRVMAGYRRWGRGVFVLVGDAEFTWNGVSNMGLAHAQNRRWTLQLLRFLSGRLQAPLKTSTTTTTSRPLPRPSSRTTTRVSAVSPTGQRRPSTSPASKPALVQTTAGPTSRPSSQRAKTSVRTLPTGAPRVYLHDTGMGLTRAGALRDWVTLLEAKGYAVTSQRPRSPKKTAFAIVPPLHAPLTRGELRFLLRFPRLVILGDGTSDMFRLKPKLDLLFQKLLKQRVVLPMPQDALTLPLGFRFGVGTVLSKEGLRAPARWRDGATVWMWRGAVLRATSRRGWKGWTVLAKTRRGSWLATSLMGFWKDNQKHEIPFSLPSAARRRGGDPVVAFNQRVFAVGDLEWLLTPGLQSPGGKKLREALHRWWKEGR